MRKINKFDKMAEKQVMVVGIDDSDHSIYALEWALDHLVTTLPNPIFKLVLVYAKPSVISSVGLIGPGIYTYILLFFIFLFIKYDLDFVIFSC